MLESRAPKEKPIGLADNADNDVFKTQIVDRAFLSKYKRRPEETVIIEMNKPEAEVENFPILFELSKNESIGQEHILDKDVFYIGRSDTNDITIFDENISRTQFKIALQDGKYSIEDMGSKNGTYVNGSLINKSQSLVNGDKIKIGPVIFCFIDKNAVILQKKISAPKYRKNHGKLIIIFSLIILLSTISFLSIKHMHGKGYLQWNQLPIYERIVRIFHSPRKAETNVAPVTREAVLNHPLALANDYMTNAKWKEAISELKTIIELDPGAPGASEAMEKAKYENANQQLFKYGKSLISNGEKDKGISILNNIQNSSFYYTYAQAGIAETKKIDNLKPAPELKKEQAATVATKKVKKPNATPKPVKKTKKRKTKQEIDSLRRMCDQYIKTAKKHYMNGDIELTLKTINNIEKLNLSPKDIVKSRALAVAEKIKTVLALSLKAEYAYKNNELASAYRILDKIIHLDSDLTGDRSSYFSRQVAVYMEDIFSKKAHEAHKKRNYTQAMDLCAKVLAINPKHKKCIRLRDILNKKMP